MEGPGLITARNEAYARRGGGRPRGRTALAVLLAAVGVAAAVFGGRSLYARVQWEKAASALLDTDRFYRGISVQGVPLGGMTREQAQAALSGKEKEAAGRYDIAITYGGKEWRLTQDDMTFAGNAADALKKAYAYGREGDRAERFRLVEALKTKPKDFPLTARLDEDALKTKVEAVAAQIDRKPAEPSVASFDEKTGTFSYKAGANGVAVDRDALWAGVKAAAEGPHTGTVAVKASEPEPSLSLAELKSRMGKLSEYSTTSTNTADGTYNMARALASVGGTAVPAGGTFSFLGTAGPCDKAHGYRPAGAILNGRLIQDYGGGICQASTTVYGAALRAGMAIAERTNHSLPSSYCPIGQDATVSYPGVDFKFRNPTPYPVYVLTHTKGRVLTAEFYGYRPPEYDEIRVSSQVTQTIPAPEKPKYVLDRTLAAGAVKFASKARTGYRAAAQRTYYKNGKAVKTEKLPSSYYKAQPAYYLYGEGTDPAKLGKAPASSAPEKKPSSSAPEQPSSAAGASSAPAGAGEAASAARGA